MKKFIAACCLFTSVFCAAQDEKRSDEDDANLERNLAMMLDSKIEMDVDRAIYIDNEGNSYFTDDKTAAIIAMVVPASYASMKEKMKNDINKKDVKMIDKGEVTIGGKKALFMKTETERDGQMFTMFIYCKENDGESCVMVTSFYKKGEDKKFTPQIEKAVASAKVKK